MSVALACVCRSADDLERFLEQRPLLDDVYGGTAIVLSFSVGAREARTIRSLPRVRATFHREGIRDGYLAVATALDVPATHVHCCDLGHLVHWAMSAPAEWREVVDAIQVADCLIIGRSEHSFRTGEPAALETERVVNMVFSRVLGHTVDLCSGNRGLSRLAARYVLAFSRPWGFEDAAWPILLYRAGFKIHHITCDRLGSDARAPVPRGMGSGSNDGISSAPDDESQYWVRKVREVLDIVQDGLLALQQPLPARHNRWQPGLAPREAGAPAVSSAPLMPGIRPGR